MSTSSELRGFESPAGATVVSSIVNTVNTVIGAGMLVLPYAMREQSILLGTLLIGFCAVANGCGMVIQGLSTKFMRPGTATFFTVCRITYPSLSIVFDLAIACQAYGVSIGYLVLTGNLLPEVYTIPTWTTDQMRLLYILLSGFITIPFCFLHKLDSLKYTSVLCLVAIAYLCVVVYYNFIYTWANGWTNLPADKVGPVSWFKPKSLRGIFKTMGVIVLAYTCPNTYSIVDELRNPTVDRTNRIFYTSMGISAAIFFTMAFFGYLTFGDALDGNILGMYDDSLFSNFARVLLVLMVLLSFPLMFHPSRISFNNIYFAAKAYFFPNNSEIQEDAEPLLSDDGSLSLSTHRSAPLSEEEIVEELEQDVPLPDVRFVWLTCLMLVVAYFSAIRLKSFETILAFVGATGGVLISYVLPGCYGYKLIGTHNPELQERLKEYGGEDAESWLFHSSTLKKCSLGLVIWGLFAMVICLASSMTA